MTLSKNVDAQGGLESVTKAERVASLTGIRAVAALLVVLLLCGQAGAQSATQASQTVIVASALDQYIVTACRNLDRTTDGLTASVEEVCDEPFKYDVKCRIPATDKARDLLGFEATTSLGEILDEVIPWIGKQIEAGVI